MWRYPALLFFAGLLIFCLIFLIGIFRSQGRSRGMMQKAIDLERTKRDNIWKEADSIRDMTALYMHIVAKHGPESMEAKAFLFGTDSRLMKTLHADNEAMQAFRDQARIIDETYRKIKS